MQFKNLENKRVALWGMGREGHAVLQAWPTYMAAQTLTVLCSADEADDPALSRNYIETITQVPDAELLSSFDYVIKSPGISLYKPEIRVAQHAGTCFTSGTALWFGEHPDAHVIGITGTKGKSTTSAMLAHVLRAHGLRTALAGNIGLPLLDLHAARAAYWVVELSSFQTREVPFLEKGIITSLYTEHLDWHGSAEQYISDKLQLAKVAQNLWVNGTQQHLLDYTCNHRQRHLFGTDDTWHIGSSNGCNYLYYKNKSQIKLDDLPVPGIHNGTNVCAVMAVLDAMQLPRAASLAALRTFTPLPHRLQTLGERDGFIWINDSIATTPQASLAAIKAQRGHAVTLLLGGYDRGLDWQEFVRAVQAMPQLRIITQGDTGARIAAAMRAAGEGHMLQEVDNLQEAIALARMTSPAGSIILLSPGAPSFDQFANYTKRGEYFAAQAGFDGAHLGRIQGLGVH